MSFTGLQIAASLMRQSRLGLDVAGRNLAGSNEAGYTRQRVQVSDAITSTTPIFNGDVDRAGVEVDGIQRVRDGLLDQAFRVRNREAEEVRVLDGFLADLETRLDGTSSLDELVGKFEEALQAVNDSPTDLSMRTDALRKAGDVAGELRSLSGSFDEIAVTAREELDSRLGRVNQILSQVGEINLALGSAGKLTSGRNELLDRRDVLLDELNGLMDVRAVEGPVGDVNLYLNNRELLHADQPETLSLDSAGNVVNSRGDVMPLRGGSVQSLQDFVFNRVPGLQANLDAVASTLISQVNGLHSLGYGLDGGTGRDLFTGTDARTIQVALTDPRHLAAGLASMQSGSPLGPLTSPGPLDAGATLASQGASGALSTVPAISGTLDINGIVVAWDDTQSLDTILANINASGSGVTARYDRLSEKVVVTRDPRVGGPSTITVTDLTGNLASVLNLQSGVPSATPGAGDGEMARHMSNRLQEPLFGSSGTRPLDKAYRDLVVDVASQRESVLAAIDRRGAAALAADDRRQAASGVSSDEELLTLMKYQQSFAAAARLASAADQMLSTLLNEVGR